MAEDRDEVSDGINRLAKSKIQRGHATWFHASSEFQSPMEVSAVRDWAKVISARHGWNITNIRKNSDKYPDCLAEFCSDGISSPQLIGVEVTELVDDEAIRAHQNVRNSLGSVYPEWPLEKFREQVEKRVRDKDKRSRDTSLKKQFLLIVTGEYRLDEFALTQYVSEVTLPRPRTFDAIYVMASYVPNPESGEGYYPVFEITLSAT